MARVLDSPIHEQARAALARHAWSEAFDLLSDADSRVTLSPDELELLGQASWWTGRLPAAIEARERAYAGYVKAGETEIAARTAISLARDNLLRSARSVAAGWLNRAERLMEGGGEALGHGWLAWTRALQSGIMGHFEEAAAQADRASAIAARFGDRDLAAQAMSGKGLSLIYAGKVDEGLALVDEAAASAVAGELDPLTAGSVCCATISACTGLGDWPRAMQWTEAQDRWCQREHINGFPGMCRLYRAETKRLRGEWLEAEAEARRASEELKGFIPAAIGVALYEIGVIRLRRGDLAAAKDVLLRAHTYGRDPEPAFSLLRLAEGRVDEAIGSIRRALEEPEPVSAWGAPPGGDLNRLSLLPAQVEIALAAADLPTARRAANEVNQLADRFPSISSRALASYVEGLVLVAEGKPSEATRLIRRSIVLWGELEAPWETARARMALAQAYAALGDRDGAALELRSAQTAFDGLGAELDRRHAEEALASIGIPSDPLAIAAATQRALKTFVFTDIVDSTRLAELLGDEGWERLLRWHDQILRSLVAERGGEEIKRTGDGFFLAFDDPGPAIECAIAIQRRLAEQGRSQGFAPTVRIGVHRDQATRVGLDYIGRGVNLAARIGAIAAGGEVLVSAATFDAAGRPLDVMERRTVELKGMSEPVEVVSLAW